MSDIRVAKRYAKSIFELAEEENTTGVVQESMQLLDSVCEESRPFILMLQNPVIRYDYKLKVIQRVFKGKVDDLTLKFFTLVCRKNRAEILPAIAKVFLDLYNESKGIVIAKIKTAVPLSDDLRAQFEKLLEKEGKQIQIEEQVDEDIIGGFVLQMDDSQADNSIRKKLKSLKRALTKE